MQLIGDTAQPDGKVKLERGVGFDSSELFARRRLGCGRERRGVAAAPSAPQPDVQATAVFLDEVNRWLGGDDAHAEMIARHGLGSVTASEGDDLVALVHEAAKARVSFVVTKEWEADLLELLAHLERAGAVVAGARDLVA